MWRALTIVALLGLAGCATPPLVRIASFALDGISYVATGKSVSDHALSIAMQQDCVMWRLVQDGDPRAVCREEEDVLVADAAGDPAQDAGLSESGEVRVASLSRPPRTVRRDRAPAVRRAPVFGPVAKGPAAAPESSLAGDDFKSGAAFARDSGDVDLAPFAPPASTEAALAVDDFKAGVMIGRGGVEPAAFGPPVQARGLLAIDDFKAATLSSRGRRDAEPAVFGPPAFTETSRPDDNFAVATLIAQDLGDAEPAVFRPPVPTEAALVVRTLKSTYLVVGSYRVPENAARVADRLTAGLSEVPMAVTPAVVDNRLFRRVLIGPIVAGDVAAARARLHDIGLDGSWKITLCSTDLSPPPCAAPRPAADGPAGAGPN